MQEHILWKENTITKTFYKVVQSFAHCELCFSYNNSTRLSIANSTNIVRDAHVSCWITLYVSNHYIINWEASCTADAIYYIQEKQHVSNMRIQVQLQQKSKWPNLEYAQAVDHLTQTTIHINVEINVRMMQIGAREERQMAGHKKARQWERCVKLERCIIYKFLSSCESPESRYGRLGGRLRRTIF